MALARCSGCAGELDTRRYTHIEMNIRLAAVQKTGQTLEYRGPPGGHFCDMDCLERYLVSLVIRFLPVWQKATGWKPPDRRESNI